MPMKKAIFLDRDGTIIADRGFVHKKEDVELLPGAARAIRMANQAGFLVVVVTNQSGVARGYFTEKEVQALHQHLTEILAQEGARIDAFYYCPHHPEATVEAYRKACSCRKPWPGLILKAARELSIDLTQSWMIGDSPRDVEAGKKAGCKTILLDENTNLEKAIHQILQRFANKPNS